MTRRLPSPLRLAVVAGVGFALLMLLAYAPGPARWLDGSALQGFGSLQNTGVADFALLVTRIGDPLTVALVGSALALVALGRGRPRHALGVIVLLSTTSIGSQVLKALLAHPRPEHPTPAGPVHPEAFPSGHSTAAMSLALAAVIVAPRRWRPLVAAVGGTAAVGVGFSVVTLGWHFPSDVVGGFLLAAGTSLGVVAALQAADARWPARRGRALVSSATRRVTELGFEAATLIGAAFVALTALAVVTRLPQIADFAARHKPALLVGPAMALAGVLVLAGVTAALSRRT